MATLKLQNPQKIAPMSDSFSCLAGKMFVPVESTQIGCYQAQLIVMKGQLNLKADSTQQVFAELTPTSFTIKNGRNQGLMAEINFQIKFELILQNQDLIKSPKVGFKLHSEKSGEIACFYHSNPETIKQWTEALRTRINQLGFHKYFKALRRLGKGQFATVFEVESFQTGHRHAVKGFSKVHLNRMPKGMESLLNQIKVMKSFRHPNLQKLECVYETQNSIYLVTELLKGGSLLNRLQKNTQMKKQMTSSDIKQFMLGILEGLSQLSEIGVVHRDLKLDNIVLRNMDDFEPVIIDFGLATFTDEPQYLYYRCGTPGYVSPQVMNSTKTTKVPPVSDVFSAGAIFHHLLTQKPVFNGNTVQEVLQMNRSFRHDFTSEIYNTVNGEALSLLKKMLETKSELRIQASEAVIHQYFLGDIKLISPVSTSLCESQRLIEEELKFQSNQ